MNAEDQDACYKDLLKAYVEGLLSKEEAQELEAAFVHNPKLEKACLDYKMQWHEHQLSIHQQEEKAPQTSWDKRMAHFIKLLHTRDTTAIQETGPLHELSKKRIIIWILIYLLSFLLLLLL
jgi:hypothetical protein